MAKKKTAKQRLSGKKASGERSAGKKAGGRARKRQAKTSALEKMKAWNHGAIEKTIVTAFPVVVAIVVLFFGLRNFNVHHPGVLPFDPGGNTAGFESGGGNLSDLRYHVSSRARYENGSLNPGDFRIENPSDNPYTIQVSLTDMESGELLYNSPTLMPGESLTDIPLSSDLPSGSYKASANIIAGDPNTGQELGQIASEVTIEVR